MFRITLFGGFQLSYRRQAVDFADRPRLQSLLAFLALNRHAPLSRIEIVNALWPDAAEDRGRNRLRNLLYHLRKILPAWETLLDVGPTSFGWRSDAPAELDIARFDTKLALAAAEDDPQRQASHLTAAVDCYAGDLFPSCVDEWIAAPRALFRSRLLDALGQLIDLIEARQDWDAARHHAEHLLAHDPLHEATYRRIMLLQARKGDTDGIERTFARCCNLLAQELDVAPDAATQSLYAQLTASTASSWTARRQAQMADKPKNLVGRAAEWTSLQHTWQQVQDGDSRLVVVQGEAGIGKTRLCQDFRHWVAQDDTLVATATCYAVEGTLAFAPVAEWLRAEPFRQSLTSLEDEWLAPIARLLPELQAHLRHASVSTPVEERLHRQQFFHALALALLGHSRPVLLYLDDLQWCDQETLDWLHYLIRYESTTPLLVLATLRTDDAAERARCRPLLRELARHDRLHEIQLKPLSRQDTATLAQHLLGDTLRPDSTARLHQETDGNPFYITETVQARPHTLLESNSPTPSTSRSAEEGPRHLPPKIRALIEDRLARLSPLAREVMQYAAVIGRRFDYAVLAAATTHSEEALVRGMEELWAQRIVREAAQNHFDFVHDKLRIAAYAQINPVRRRFLHKHIAAALDAHADAQTDESCLQIAQHYRQAGEPAQAAEHYQRAVHVAAQRYAIESLLSASTIGLELLQQLDPQKRDRANLYRRAALIEERVWSWEMVGDMNANLRDLTLLREIGAALKDDDILNRESRFRAAALIRLGRYREAEDVAHAGADRQRAAGAAEDEGISHTVIGRARRELGDYAGAVTAFHRALALLARAEAHVYRIQAYSYLSTTYWQMGNYENAFQCGRAALAICEAQHMPERRRFAWGDMGAAAAMLGRSHAARQWLQDSLDLAQVVSDAPQEVFCRGHLGHLALSEGDFEEAERQLQAAYSLSRRADTVNYVSWLLRGLAEVAAVTEQAARAQVLAAEALSVAQANQQAGEVRAAQDLLVRLR